jgi:putative phosphoribosyl transferase
MRTRFDNREHAGKILAEKCQKFVPLDPVILALPRGGVPIAHQIALALHSSIDVIFVKKIGAPRNEEFAIGAIAEDGKAILNDELISINKFKKAEIDAIAQDRLAEIKGRSNLYRKYIPQINLEGRNVIVVDDGLATGATMEATLLWLKTQKVKKIIVAVPVSSKDAALKITTLCDEFISLITPEDMWAVGMWYQDFDQVSDDEVISIFQKQTGISKEQDREVWIEDGMNILQGHLHIPKVAKGIIMFAHGGGSSHKSPRNQFVAKALNETGFATLLFDLLTFNESLNRKNVFDIELMTKRLLIATEWTKKHVPNIPIGYFGASTGAAAALKAAANKLEIFAVVSRGGRPDLAIDQLPEVYAPTLLIVGEADDGVIELNQLAKNKMSNCQLVLIPKATHLFEEPGTLEEVVEFALSWFNSNLPVESPAYKIPVKESIINEIEEHSTTFNGISDLNAWIKSIAHHKIIMLGESTHGTKEYYALRAEISKKLIDEYDYRFIAVEGDWPDCYYMTKHIYSTEERSSREVVMKHFRRWPTWMWANDEIPKLIDWMKQSGRCGFYGLDVYSLFESMDEIKKHLIHITPKIAGRILEGYRCFESYQCNEIDYAKSLLKMPRGCQEEVVSNLRELLRVRLEETSLTKEQLFDVKQNARVINNAEKYYRTMMTGGADSWNIRDHHMMETLENLLNLHGPNAKCIVWAHNTHIGDYHATDMLESGYINLGGLAREKFGMEQVYLTGFSSYQGEVTAGKAWGAPFKKMVLPKAKAGSIEDYFHKSAMNLKATQLLTDLKNVRKDSTLNRVFGHRAVGVVYDPNHESHGNYVPTSLAKRYDAMIFVDRTTSLSPLSDFVATGEFPETYPIGQ